MLRLMPRMLALMAVQRHTAASRSTSPLTREQQGSLGDFPSFNLTKSSWQELHDGGGFTGGGSFTDGEGDGT
ncbi:unnamed protein product [Spirodela intermedia]|uniref:Uncharacterized protein n=1 Tax=Spirodela intermedia TaxID=51605 RepID=A0A7I8K8V9_SPIIN|nr:unnamed protein product [Spirodela intermedia]